MIQFISLIDIEGGGVPKWDFIHPAAPERLRDRLQKYRKLASSFIYAVITAFGEEIVGQRIRELRLSEIKFIFMPLEHEGHLFYAVFIVDMKDNPVATRRAFMRFYEKNYTDFDEILIEEMVSKHIIEELRHSMAQFLDPLARDNELFCRRDTLHFLSSYMVSLLCSGALTSLLWGVNQTFSLMESHPISIAVLVFGCLFVLPGIPIGILTQYGRHAIGVAFLNSVTIVIGATLLWQEILLSSAETIVGATIVREILIASATLVGTMLGTMLALISFVIAKFFERRKLTCITPFEKIPKLAESHKETTNSPPAATMIDSETKKTQRNEERRREK